MPSKFWVLPELEASVGGSLEGSPPPQPQGSLMLIELEGGGRSTGNCVPLYISKHGLFIKNIWWYLVNSNNGFLTYCRKCIK